MYQTLKSLIAPKTISEVTYDDIFAQLKGHSFPPPNKLLEQHRFLCRTQSDSKSISDYVRALRGYLENSDFKRSCGVSAANQFLGAQFIRGIKSLTIREKLLCKKALDFDKAVTLPLSLENSELDNLVISNGSSSHVNKVYNAHHSRSSSQRAHHSGNDDDRSNTPHQRNRSNQRYHQRRSSQGSYHKPKRQIDYGKLGIADLCIKCRLNNHRAFECKTNPANLKCNSCTTKGHICSR
ncbi:uncharacterized protein [Bemisia tabaci]|uniref:uncharacterized protein n=1 Tax=Bemisia tabaci TaxID=7038 RepID=UPI003B289E25